MIGSMNTFVIDKESLKKGWGAEGQYWFSLTDYTIKEDYYLIQLSVPDDLDEDEYINGKNIIPYFNVKRYELAKAYIMSLDNKKIKEKFEVLKDGEIVELFWKYFHVYPELFKQFEEFQTEFLLKKAIEWCDENKIEYTVAV